MIENSVLVTAGISIFKNVTAKQWGSALTADVSEAAGVSVQRLNPVGTTVQANGGPLELHVQGAGIEHNLSNGETLAVTTSGTIGGLRLGIMAGIGVEAALNPETFKRLAKEQGCFIPGQEQKGE
jgi:hypothetical protein